MVYEQDSFAELKVNGAVRLCSKEWRRVPHIGCFCFHRKLVSAACILLAAKISSDLKKQEVKHLIDVSLTHTHTHTQTHTHIRIVVVTSDALSDRVALAQVFVIWSTWAGKKKKDLHSSFCPSSLTDSSSAALHGCYGPVLAKSMFVNIS